MVNEMRASSFLFLPLETKRVLVYLYDIQCRSILHRFLPPEVFYIKKDSVYDLSSQTF